MPLLAILLPLISLQSIIYEPLPSTACQACDVFTEIGTMQKNRYIRYKVDYDSLKARTLVTEKTGGFYAIVISYSSLTNSLIQTRHLVDQGYRDAGILKINDHYSIFIQKAISEDDDDLIEDTSKWMYQCGSSSQVYIRKH